MEQIENTIVKVTNNKVVYLKDVATRANGSEAMVENLIASLAKLLYNVLPNLNDFDLRTQMLNLPINSPPVDAQIPELIMYGSLYALTGYILALWLFHRKEL